MFFSLDCICLFSFFLSILIAIFNRKHLKYHFYLVLITGFFSLLLAFIHDKYDTIHFLVIFTLVPFITILFIFNVLFSIFAFSTFIKKINKKIKKQTNDKLFF